MEYIVKLLTTESVAHAILIFSLVIAVGLALGSLSFFNIRFGVAGVLFSGIIFGHFHLTIAHEILEFVKEFGLILFVYTIGLQVGPGFFSSFKKDGIRLNMMAASIVGLGVIATILISHFAHIPMSAAVGMFSGATTNTPSLAAAQQALKDIPSVTPEMLAMPSLGYAVAYPFGVLGIIIVILMTKGIFRINSSEELKKLEESHGKGVSLTSMDVVVENKNLNGLSVDKIPGLKKIDVVISRISHKGEMSVAFPSTIMYLGDVIRAVGSKEDLDDLLKVVGSKTQMDLRGIKGNVTTRRVILTKHHLDGKALRELNSLDRYGITITRVTRGDVEMPASPDIELRYADTLLVVGDEMAIKKFAGDVGNSPKQLDHPFIIPIFVGLSLGVLLGTFPIHIPGIPTPVKLGLAGGPLIVAILLSRVGRIGNLLWYMPTSANLMLREFGISLFLACVGLISGDHFVELLVNGQGFYWMGFAALITFVPIFLVALVGRIKFKLNFFSLCGLLSGSMTDPPALAFANSLSSSSSSASISYATVYPLVMILRVVSAQILVLFFIH